MTIWQVNWVHPSDKMGEFLLIIVLIELISVWFTSIQKICVAKWKLIVVDDTHNYGFVDTEKTKIICNSEENTHDFFLLAIRTLIDGCYRRHRWWLSLHRQQIQSTSIKSPSLKWFFFLSSAVHGVLASSSQAISSIIYGVPRFESERCVLCVCPFSH